MSGHDDSPIELKSIPRLCRVLLTCQSMDAGISQERKDRGPETPAGATGSASTDIPAELSAHSFIATSGKPLISLSSCEKCLATPRNRGC